MVFFLSFFNMLLHLSLADRALFPLACPFSSSIWKALALYLCLEKLSISMFKYCSFENRCQSRSSLSDEVLQTALWLVKSCDGCQEPEGRGPSTPAVQGPGMDRQHRYTGVEGCGPAQECASQQGAGMKSLPFILTSWILPRGTLTSWLLASIPTWCVYGSKPKVLWLQTLYSCHSNFLKLHMHH